MRPTSPAGNNSRPAASRGFVLIDLLATLAITGLALALVWPAIPTGTTQPRLAAIAIETVTLLRTTRTAAIASGRDQFTAIDTGQRSIQTDRQILTLPGDVALSVLSADSCRTTGALVGIAFHADGSSCGAVIRLVRQGRGYRIRVDWTTGHIAVLPG